MSYADEIADMPVSPGSDDDTRTLGTLFFAASWPMKFVLESETWPVFAAWYAQQRAEFGQAPDPPGEQARTELEDMVDVLRVFWLAGTK